MKFGDGLLLCVVTILVLKDHLTWWQIVLVFVATWMLNAVIPTLTVFSARYRRRREGPNRHDEVAPKGDA